MAAAIQQFHDLHPEVALQLNVTRRPYSFLGDADQKAGRSSLRSGGTWHEGLIDYTGGSEERAFQAEKGLQHLGGAAGIKFRFDVKTNWQPIDSQRLLLWAGRFGKQEEFMSAMNHRHFENAESASDRNAILKAAEDVGLPVDEANAFLDTNELHDEVWKSYGDTINVQGIHSIPLFVFNVPSTHRVGGPFREHLRTPGQKWADPYTVNGSMDAARFLDIFEMIFYDINALATSMAKVDIKNENANESDVRVGEHK